MYSVQLKFLLQEANKTDKKKTKKSSCLNFTHGQMQMTQICIGHCENYLSLTKLFIASANFKCWLNREFENKLKSLLLLLQNRQKENYF